MDIRGLLGKLIGMASGRGKMLGSVGAAVYGVVDSGGLAGVEEAVWGAVAEEVKMRTGLQLDPLAPLSDASLSAAISELAGADISTVYDGAALRRDVAAHVSGVVSAKTGVELSDVTDASAVRADLAAHGGALIADASGLVLSDVLSPAAVRADVQAYVKDRLDTLVASRITEAADSLAAGDAGILELMGLVKHAQDLKGVRLRDVAIGTAAAGVLAGYAALDRQIARQVRRFRRQEQNRLNQRAFRERHGNRMEYQPIGGA